MRLMAIVRYAEGETPPLIMISRNTAGTVIFRQLVGVSFNVIKKKNKYVFVLGYGNGDISSMMCRLPKNPRGRVIKFCLKASSIKAQHRQKSNQGLPRGFHRSQDPENQLLCWTDIEDKSVLFSTVTSFQDLAGWNEGYRTSLPMNFLIETVANMKLKEGHVKIMPCKWLNSIRQPRGLI